MSEESFVSQVKRLLVGAPIPSHLAHHERFSRVTGLAVLSSDPLSSVAYATEEVLRVLAVGGIAALALVTPISVVIATMLAIVVFSYRQTIHAYPNGGGAYIVAKENLGRAPSLVAAAALLIDYVLTVAVSIAAGVAAITSALPDLHVSRIGMSLMFVAMLMLGNLRGVRESGRLFAAPTYFFVGSIFVMLADGSWRFLSGDLAVPIHPSVLPTRHVDALATFAILTAFSNGCTAMTGVEAVSNGVPAFRPPESKNAAATLVTMAVLAISMFMASPFSPTATTSCQSTPKRWSPKSPGPRSAAAALCTTPPRRPPCSFSCWRPTQRTRTSPGWRRSSHVTGSCRASS